MLGLPNELDLEEWQAEALEAVGPERDTLVLSNRGRKPIDQAGLTAALGRVEGIERVKRLVVRPSSRVEDVRFVAALPSLEELHLQGGGLLSLDGIESFRRGRYLAIKTGKNRKRDISRLCEAPITKLSLGFAKAADLQAIARSTTVRHLEVMSTPTLDLREWRAVPLELLALWGGAIDRLEDTEDVPTLRQATLYGCRKLRRFDGRNGNVTWMVIQVCNLLEWPTIGSFRNLQHLAITKIKPRIPLSSFAGLPALRSLSLAHCTVAVDDPHLKRSAPKLEELRVSPLEERLALELSRSNPAVVVSNGVRAYRDGIAVDG